MGVYPETYVINSKIFDLPECPKGFEEHVKGISGEINIGGEKLFVIAWCQHYSMEPFDDLEIRYNELTDYITEEEKDDEIVNGHVDSAADSYRIMQWLDALGGRNENLFWSFSN